MCATPRYVVGLVRGGLLVWNHAGGESRGIACDSSQLLGVYIVSDAFVFVWDTNKHFLFNLETGNVAAVEFPASQIHVPYRVASYLCATVLVLTKNNPTNPTDILRVYDAETGVALGRNTSAVSRICRGQSWLLFAPRQFRGSHA